MPKSKTIALVDFLEPTEARAAYKGLAYRRYKHVPLYLEWAPLGTINKASVTKMTSEGKSKPNENEKESEKNVRGLTEAADADAEDSCGTLYVKNLNFITTEESLRAHLESLGAKGIRTVLIQKKTKGSIVLSQGYGFVEFESESAAKIAEKLCNGSLLDSHALQVNYYGVA